MGENRRKLKRWHLIYYLRVFEITTGNLAGHVVDINDEGVKLISEKTIDLNEKFKFKMNYPQEDGMTGELFLEAQSLWNEVDINPSFYCTGFRIVNPDARDIDIIRKLIDRFNFNF
jgi:hypothetical protein